jgi:hypothetical protein
MRPGGRPAREWRLHPDGSVERTERYAGLVRAGAEPSTAIERIGPESRPLDLDARRRVLEQRIERTKERLLADLGRAKTIVVRAKDRARKGAWTAALVAGGLLFLGLVTTLVRRRTRRVRVTWR